MNKPIARNNIATCTLKRLAFCLNFAYIKGTTLNHVVSFSRLFCRKGAQTPFSIFIGVFLCLPFNGGRARDIFGCAGFPFLRQSANLRMTTALIFSSINGSFLNQQIRKLYKMSITTPSKQVKTTTPKQGIAKKRPFVRQFFYKYRVKRAINALNSNKPLLDRLRAYNKNSINV